MIVAFAAEPAVSATNSAGGSGQNSPQHQAATNGSGLSGPYITHDHTEDDYRLPAEFVDEPLAFIANEAIFLGDLGVPFDTLQVDAHTSSTTQRTQGASQWPLKSYEEARIFRYFITDLSRWFDAGDPEMHFTCVVPELAQNCPALLNAILCLSSKQLSHLGKIDESVSLGYQDACFKALLPELQEKAFEAPQLAAVVMLRLVLLMTGISALLDNTFVHC